MRKIIPRFLFVAIFLYSSVVSAEYTIRVNFNNARLYLLEDEHEIESFPVALPRGKTKLPVTGTVEKVEENPSWGPTEGTREYYLKKNGVPLPKIVSPNDPRNAMGKGKIRIHFNEKHANQNVRIHGTNQEEFIGQRVSRGCIRMKNNDIKKLSEIIRGKKTIVVFN